MQQNSIKILLLFFFCLKVVLSCESKPNPIDSLYTSLDIEFFVKSFDYGNFEYNKCIQNFTLGNTDYMYETPRVKEYIQEHKNIKLWYKGDFDDNGLTDLLVYGKSNGCGNKLICFFAYPQKVSYTFIHNKYTDNYPTGFNYIVPEVSASQEVLLHNFSFMPFHQTDTLISILGAFIEKKHFYRQQHNMPEKVTYVSHAFNMEVYKSGKVSLEVVVDRIDAYTGEAVNTIMDEVFFDSDTEDWGTELDTSSFISKGIYMGTIATADSLQLFGLINTINWKSMEGVYNDGISESRFCELNVTQYADDKYEEVYIKDDGCHGNYTLSNIYAVLHRIIHSLKSDR